MRRMMVEFQGRVQGVGFRFTAVSIAASFDIAGYVRNEMDGSVRLVAEGEDKILVDFLHALRASTVGRCIFSENVSWGAASGEYDDFGVRY